MLKADGSAAPTDLINLNESENGSTTFSFTISTAQYASVGEVNLQLVASLEDYP